MAERLPPASPGHGTPRYVAARYRLDSPIGRGGAGVVWCGEDELLQRPVAIKEILVPLAGAQVERDATRARVLREARALARLHSPSIVTVFDVVEEAERHWIVMELVDADSLGEVIKTHGPLPFGQVAAIGLALADALAAAHSAGVLHRDVKPGNVLLGRDGKVRLTDFGIAATEGDATLTGTGALVGSPAYIAPERVRGASGTPASDLWGLGATLYSAVEGSPPFEGPETYAVLTAVVEGRRRPFRLAGPLRSLLTDLLDRPAAERPDVEEIRRRLSPIARNADPVPTWVTNARSQSGDGGVDAPGGADVLEEVVDRPEAAGFQAPPPPGSLDAEATSTSGRAAAPVAGPPPIEADDEATTGDAAQPVARNALDETSVSPVTGGRAAATWSPAAPATWSPADGGRGDSGLLPVTDDVRRTGAKGNRQDSPRKMAVIAGAAAVAIAGAVIVLASLLSSGDGSQQFVDPAANASTAPPATVAGEVTTKPTTRSGVTAGPEATDTRPYRPTPVQSPTVAQTSAEPEPTQPTPSESPTSPSESPSPTPSESPTDDGSSSPSPPASETPPVLPPG